jgi:hypothetical protein
MRYKLLSAVVGLGLLSISGAASAASIKFNFDNGSSLGTSSFGAAVSNVGAWSMTNGSPTFIDTLGSSTIFDFVWGKGWNGQGNDYKFTFTVSSGFTVALTDLSFYDASESFDVGRNSAIFGPTNWSLSVDLSVFGSGLTHGGIGGTNTVNPPDLILGAGTHTVLLHAFGANGSNRHWAVDNFVLNGISGIASPVPLPPAAWLFGSALLGMIGIGRRQAASERVVRID